MAYRSRGGRIGKPGVHTERLAERYGLPDPGTQFDEFLGDFRGEMEIGLRFGEAAFLRRFVVFSGVELEHEMRGNIMDLERAVGVLRHGLNDKADLQFLPELLA